MQSLVNNFEMAYEVRGQGLPLLLVHGFPLNKELWEPQLTALQDVARLIAPDLRGHGASEPVPGEYSMDLLAGDCHALLENLGIEEPAVVCGLSMGGYIALAYYRRYPERLAGLILAATRAGPDSPEAKANRDKMAARAEEKGAGAIAEDMLPKMLSPETYTGNPELVARVRQIMAGTSVPGIRGALLGMKARPDATPLLAGIDVPTLVLHGEDDQLIPVEEAQAMHAAIPDSRLEVLPGAGHLLNLERPDAFNRAVRRFLGSLSGQASAVSHEGR
jgi:pimeloyl-ACP methyl ester carboxylesterase